ncbi:MAG TPA: hypothetical protein VH186_15535 [Chloroflexia bacterium]|nr:hypothetical protein [Chloroflexia bacterium]
MTGLFISLLLAFLTFANVLRRIYHNPTLATARNNRYFFYVTLFTFLSISCGLVGEATGNNWVFYGASVSTELMNYFGLCWVRLNLYSANEGEKEVGIIVRPVALGLLMLTNAFELITFQLAGREAFNTLKMADHHQASKNIWLVIGLLATLVYVLGATLFILAESLRGMHQSGKLSFKYRCVTLALISIWGTAYFSTDLGRYLLFLSSGNTEILEKGLNLRNLFGLAAFATVGTLVFFDSKIFKWIERRYERLLLKYVCQLRGFYEYSTARFPAEFRFSPYPAIGTKPPSWVLNEVLDGLADLRNYFWQAEAKRQTLKKGVANIALAAIKPITLEQEAAVWARCLQEPVETNQLTASMQHSVDIPPQAVRSNELEQHSKYYVKLVKEVSCILGVSFYETTLERKKDEVA